MKIRYGTILAVVLMVCGWWALVTGDVHVAYMFGLSAVVAAVLGTLE